MGACLGQPLVTRRKRARLRRAINAATRHRVQDAQRLPGVHRRRAWQQWAWERLANDHAWAMAWVRGENAR